MKKISEQYNSYKIKKGIDKLSDEEVLNEVENCKRENFDLKQSINDLDDQKVELTKAYQENMANEEKREAKLLNDLDEQTQALIKQNIELDNKKALLSNKHKNEVQKLDDEMAQLKKEHLELFESKAELSKSDFEAKKADLESKIATIKESKEAELKEYQRQVDELNREHEALKNNQEATMIELHDEEIELTKDYQAKMDELDKQASEKLEAHKNAVELVKDDYQKQVATINRESNATYILMREQLLSLMQEKETLKKNLSDQAKAFEMFKNELETDFDNKLWQFKKLESQALAKKQLVFSEYESKLDEYKNLCNEYQVELEAKNQSLNAIYELLRSEKSQKESGLIEAISNYDEQLAKEYHDKIGYYDLELKKQKNNYDLQIDKLNSELKAVEGELFEQNQQLHEAKKQLISDNNQEIERLKSEQAEYRQSLNDKKATYQLNITKKQNDISTDEKNYEIKYQDVLQDITLKLNACKEEWSLKNDELNKQIEAEKQAIFEAKNKLENETTAFEQKRNDFNNEIENRKREWEEKIAGLNSEIESTIQKQTILKDSQANLEAEYQKQFDEIAQKQTLAKQEHEASLKMMDEKHQSDKNELNVQYETKLEELKIQSEAELEKLSVQNSDEQEALNQKHQAKLEEYERVKNELLSNLEIIKANHEDELAKQKTLREEITNAIEASRVDFEKTIDELETMRLDREKQHHSHVNRLYENYETDLRNLNDESQAKLSALKNEKLALEEEYRRLSTSLDNKREANQNEMFQKESEYDNFKLMKNNEVYALEEKLGVINDQIDEARKLNDIKNVRFNEKLQALKDELAKQKQDQQDEVDAYNKQRGEELRQFASSTAAMITALKQAYDIKIERKTKDNDLQRQSLINEYDQKHLLLDEELNDLRQRQDQQQLEQENAYRINIDETLRLQNELETLKRTQEHKLFELREAFSLRQNEIAFEGENLKKGYEDTLATYRVNYENQVAMRNQDKERLKSEIEDLKKAIAFENMAITSYRENMAIEKMAFEEEIAILESKKASEIALISQKRDEVIESYKTKVAEQEAFFEELSSKLKELLEGKPLIFAKYHQEFENSLSEEKAQYISAANDIKQSFEAMLKELDDEQVSFLNDARQKMDELYDYKLAMIKESEEVMIEMAKDYANKNAVEATKQSLARLGIENEKSHFDRLLSEMDQNNASLEADYQAMMDALNLDFENAKAQLQTQMASETHDYEAEIAQLQALRQEKFDTINNLKEELANKEANLFNSMETMRNSFMQKCEETEAKILSEMEDQRRQLDAFDKIGQEINPIFTHHE